MNQYISSIKEMQTQLFHVLAVAASMANLCGVLLNAFLHGYAMPTQVCILCGVVILAFGVWGMFIKNKGWAVVGILITVVWIEFPLLYMVYSDVILVYFVLSILGITIFFPSKFSIPFCIITIVWDIVIVVMAYYRPVKIVHIEEKHLVMFSACSYLIVAAAVFALVNILIMRYERQKEELQQMNMQLEYLATHDPLTKLYNRGYLMNEIEKRIQTNNASFIAVIMDVDNFKQINDNYGHSFGDLVLTVFADLLNKETEGKGFAARFGGEEFMIIFDHDDQNAAMQALHHLAVQLESHFQRENQISVTFSGGLEVYNSRKKVDELISSADKKLYQAKHNGKNQIII